jgi:hypothetical protein
LENIVALGKSSGKAFEMTPAQEIEQLEDAMIYSIQQGDEVPSEEFHKLNTAWFCAHAVAGHERSQAIVEQLRHDHPEHF